MKINLEFNSTDEMFGFCSGFADGLKEVEQEDLPFGTSSWKQAYEMTFANLERAYERIREFNDLKKNNKVIHAEIEKIERKLAAQADKEHEALRKDHINNLLFAVRAHNCLISAGIITISQLLTKTEADLMKIPNFGKLSLKDVKDTLKANNLKLKGTK
jgi:DNA-directed RNA polymerase alpha subunit